MISGTYLCRQDIDLPTEEIWPEKELQISQQAYDFNISLQLGAPYIWMFIKSKSGATSNRVQIVGAWMMEVKKDPIAEQRSPPSS